MKKNLLDYKPDFYQKDIYSIDYQKLLKNNIKYLIFDLDNTILECHKSVVSKKTIDLFKKLESMNFKLILLSNSLKYRVMKNARLINADFFHFSCKPFQFNYRKILAKYKDDKSSFCAIADQVFTDVVGAKKIGIKSFLVEPLDQHDTIFTIINRHREKSLFKKMEKEKIFTKGKYYE